MRNLITVSRVNLLCISGMQRDSGRPYWPKPRVAKSPEDEDEDGLAVHPAIPRVSYILSLYDTSDGSFSDLENISGPCSIWGLQCGEPHKHSEIKLQQPIRARGSEEYGS